MPHSASAAKRHRQSLKRRAQNRAMKSAVKTQVKKVRAAVKDGDLAKAETEFKLAVKRLDRAGSKKYIHPNAAFGAGFGRRANNSCSAHVLPPNNGTGLNHFQASFQ